MNAVEVIAAALVSVTGIGCATGVVITVIEKRADRLRRELAHKLDLERERSSQLQQRLQLVERQNDQLQQQLAWHGRLLGAQAPAPGELPAGGPPSLAGRQ
jgi:hypothetical protein